ncbi:hypothetical protein [Coprococcus eutactus]|jgi:hypothetical protein|uniref:hypothetical protein n=1 Tax=Coprococcus eutactus TaxID=33043 RepID=UPI0020488F67|nr:MAG TPA: ASCH domain protein [Caudoviricetes sp.]
MAIKPILFNTEMVRAILDRRKSCTRRIVNPQPQGRLCYTFAGGDCGTWGYPSKTAYENWGDEYKLPEDITDEELKRRWNPPYHTDDILYVRETWRKGLERYIYRADYSDTEKFYRGGKEIEMKWHPSIHMPKEAARIWLKVTDVRVERLQECGKGWCLDIEKEGIVTPQNPILYISDEKFHEALRYEFEKMWNSTIKKSDLDRYGWNANPWVWVIEFERCERGGVDER